MFGPCDIELPNALIEIHGAAYAVALGIFLGCKKKAPIPAGTGAPIEPKN